MENKINYMYISPYIEGLHAPRAEAFRTRFMFTRSRSSEKMHHGAHVSSIMLKETILCTFIFRRMILKISKKLRIKNRDSVSILYLTEIYSLLDLYIYVKMNEIE